MAMEMAIAMAIAMEMEMEKSIINSNNIKKIYTNQIKYKKWKLMNVILKKYSILKTD